MKLRKPFEKMHEARTSKSNEDVIEENQESGDCDENVQRGNWSNQIEFLLSCVSYAVGVGNIWRFPYLCMRNGGGAFLIPYFTFMLLCGMPLFYLELALGQFSSLSVISVWKISPLFKGVGIATIVATGIVTLYYNVILSWVLYYLFNSFTWTLPWGTCGNAWNTELCLARKSVHSDTGNASLGNMTELGSTETMPVYNQSESNIMNEARKHHTPAEEFWHYNVLEISSGIEELGGIQWKLFGTLLLSWIIVFLCLFKGVKTSGKAVYVTATVPYFFLTILLIRGLTLPGSFDGIMYYLTPDWSRLLEFKVWVEACLQIFYSLGPGWGSLITMASYNRFNNRLHVDATLVPIINCGTSFYGGLVIFSIIGFMAHDAGLSVEEVVTSGPGLAFIAYPEALHKLPISPMWAVMFFVMLLNIGLGTQFAMVETISSGFIDKYPRIMKYFRRRWAFTAFVCFTMFVVSLPFVTKAGIYIFQICDWYVAAISVQLIAVLECVVVSVIYGIKRFSYDIECMIGSKPFMITRIWWTCGTPLLITLILIISMKGFPVPYYGDYNYPVWAIALGWLLACSSLVPIPLYAIWSLKNTEGPLLMRLRNVLKPSSDWGPALEKHRENYKYNVAGPVRIFVGSQEISSKADEGISL